MTAAVRSEGAAYLLDAVARAAMEPPPGLKVLRDPNRYVLSIIRSLARRRRILDADDVLAASQGVGVTRQVLDEALTMACYRRLIQRKPGHANRYYSRIFAT